MPKGPADEGDETRFERVFTLRMWRESEPGGPGVLRGSVVEVGTDRRFYFTRLGDLKDFLSVRLAQTDRDRP
jgi:hypothetical protein